MPDSKIIRLEANPEGFGETADELSEEQFASSLPTQHSHEYYADEDLGLYIGVWDTDDMVEAAGPYACEEFMWLIEGEAVIRNTQTGAQETARAGEPFIIPKAYDCQWHQRGYLRKFYVIWERPEEAFPESPVHEGIIIARTDAPLTATTDSVSFAVVVGATPAENVWYTDGTGKFVSGTWHSGAFEAQAQPFPHHEFLRVQDGSICLKDEAGTEHQFTAGDTFFIPKGTICSARVEDSVTVFFARLCPS